MCVCVRVGVCPGRSLIIHLWCAQLFVGTLTSTYSVWDIADDCIFRNVEGSDSYQLAKKARGSGLCLCFCVSSGRVLGIIWWILSLGLIVAAVIAGIVAFPQTQAQQQTQSDNFLDSSPGS